MPRPLAYFLTWTCYGTWLHGDARGSVDLDHNAPGTPYLPPYQQRMRTTAQALHHAPVNLNQQARGLVTRTILGHCTIRGWTAHALNVRTNHVHIIVTCPSCRPEVAMNQFKSWCTRHLREAGLVSMATQVWTHHGSTRYLNSEASLAAAMDYVVYGQDRHVP